MWCGMEICVLCDETFANRIELERHVEDEHPELRGRVKIRI